MTFRPGMLVPVRVIASQQLIEKALADQSFEQAINATTLPGTVGKVIVMPDVHQGYGFPIGGVSLTRYPQGVISPGAIGYDINCGIRLGASSIKLEVAEPFLESLASRLEHYCPSGIGVDGSWKLSESELNQIFRTGLKWALNKGYANRTDLVRTEDQGCITGADPNAVSKRAKERGRPQLGTLGSGNHFIEVGVVERIFDEKIAQVMGLRLNCLTLLIHSGSRGLGHQICTDYVQSFQSAVNRYGIHIVDRELVCAPLNSPDGMAYLGAMRSAANYAFVNRQLLLYSARRAFEDVFAGKVNNWNLTQVYDIAHNIGRIESHIINGKKLKVCVHRKGATRAIAAGAPGLPEEYRQIGQPVLVPGSMGTFSWVLVGDPMNDEISYESSCHGAGRSMSRSQAKKGIRGDKLKADLNKAGIIIRSRSLQGLAEEAPQAYKDVDEVIEAVCSAGIVRRVARLQPVIVVKG